MKSLVIERTDLEKLFSTLVGRGYRLIGPTLREAAIVYGEIKTVNDLPIGWTDGQAAGQYRLQRRGDAALFGYNLGPHSWKKENLPPSLRLFSAERRDQSFVIIEEPADELPMAFIGARSCELHAISIQDRVLMQGPFVDPTYARRRNQTLVIAVNCGQAGGTCFCVSMKSGPQATQGFDIALTEVLDGHRHYFLTEVGTTRGAEILNDVPHRAARDVEKAAAQRIVDRTAATMGRKLYTGGLKEFLYSAYENPHWDDVAARCLSCANCTMVCPTCFCTTVEDVTDLSGAHAERWQKWDSCFTADFSYIHGGSVRSSTKSRYRQWLTHKLATWMDQFSTPGCVGCGRCITWCPTGIDITQEVVSLRERQPGRKEQSDGEP
ncbi:MAG: 4Fe-4S dicluster domain-containing protein [Acidobacteria bacterium]|nr:4Fe-4S dicluster domain-containing protein [Acidobacteriota bacterium]MBI3655197.1 4Fe-4S dicluster domain-containing protein [Acidobacteriota bacterium]